MILRRTTELRDKFHGPHRPERTGGLQSSGCATGTAYSEEPILHIEAGCDRTGNLKPGPTEGFDFAGSGDRWTGEGRGSFRDARTFVECVMRPGRKRALLYFTSSARVSSIGAT